MARYIGSLCRQCRREKVKLFLKGDRCLTEKCALDRRNYGPGQHGQRRGKTTEYGVQLREKQKVKRIYQVLERQFRTYFHQADRIKGVTGETLLRLLEQRLDNVVFRLGFASSRNGARQMVRHNHILVNGKRVNIPSYQVEKGDVVEVKETSRKNPVIISALETKQKVAEAGIPQWLQLDAHAFKGTVTGLPRRDDITAPIKEQLIVELYSK